MKGNYLTPWFALVGFCATTFAVEFNQIRIEPQEAKIGGSRERIQFVVTGFAANNEIADVTHDVAYEVSDEKILKVSASGVAVPKSNGRAMVTVQHGTHKVSVAVTVTGQESPERVSFDYHTLPLLAKAGCSGGSCHGSPHGKAGFQLSLFATDPDLDRRSLVRQSRGRRVNMIEPAKSLLLRKPTMKLPHEGGKRLTKNDPLYTLLHDWIGEGCRIEPDEKQCLGIEVFPSNARVLKHPVHAQQFRVLANFTDGSKRDVTHLAKFDTSDINVASATPSGRVVGVNRGDVAVIIRYLEHIQTPMLTFVQDIEGFTWNDPPTRNFIDQRVDDRLRQLQYLPSEICDDKTFLRRVYLDVIGLLPTRDEYHRFVDDTSEDKRAKLIDQLLERPEHGRFWAQKWGDLLRVSRKQIGLESVYKYNRWLQHVVSTNMPYDQFAREILTVSGSTYAHPAGNYFRTAGDTNDAMETTAQLFLGTRIQCAKCHNHPFERWTQDNYYGLAAFFNRIERKKTSRQEEVFLWFREDGEVTNPRTGRPSVPWIPIDGEMPVDARTDRRVAFANWLVEKDNPFFARVEVNRIWAHLLGRGIVEPFDDFRDSNPPSNAPLLESLAKDFVKSGFDRRHIIRTILNSRTYQSSARPNEFNRDDQKYFSHYFPRRLSAEQLVDGLGQVTGRPKQFPFVAAGTKATWLPAPDLKPHNRAELGNVEFLKVFGQPERQSACSCERGEETSLGQALQLFNGQFIHEMLTDGQTRFRKALNENKPHDEIVNDLFIHALSRLPSETERKKCLAYLAASDDKVMTMEDICWAIVNKSEFLFQH